MQMQAQVDENRDRSQAEQTTLKMQQDAQLKQLEASYADQAHDREQAMKWQIEQLKSATAIEVAQIAAAVKMNDTATRASTAEISANVNK